MCMIPQSNYNFFIFNFVGELGERFEGGAVENFSKFVVAGEVAGAIPGFVFVIPICLAAGMGANIFQNN